MVFVRRGGKKNDHTGRDCWRVTYPRHKEGRGTKSVEGKGKEKNPMPVGSSWEKRKGTMRVNSNLRRLGRQKTQNHLYAKRALKKNGLKKKQITRGRKKAGCHS